jgi:uncharacterized protein YndB with AHSA1/START domain
MADDTYTVVRSASVDAPPHRVYEQVADFRNWPHWSPWEDLDPDLKRTYSGAEAGTGAVYEWSGNRKAGQGRMEVLEAVDPSKVRIDLQFLKPFKARNETTFDIVGEGDGSRVTWTMHGRRTPALKVMGIFRSMDKMIGPDFEKGLSRLKATTETPAP